MIFISLPLFITFTLTQPIHASTSRNLLSLDISLNNWSTPSNLSLPRDVTYGAIAYSSQNNTIWLLGGHTYYKSLVAFDLNNNIFNDYGNKYLSVSLAQALGQSYTQINDYVYILTGGVGNSVINRFNVNSASSSISWTSYQSPPQSFQSDEVCLASASHNNNDYLFLLGRGCTGCSPPLSTRVQILNLTAMSWLSNSNIPQMNEERSEMSCMTSTNHRLYAIGGSTNTVLDSVEYLDVQSFFNGDSVLWTGITHTLSQKLSSTRAISYDTDIIVFGGYDINIDAVSVINVIDTLTNTITVKGNLWKTSVVTPAIMVNNIAYVFGTNSWGFMQLGTLIPTSSPTPPPTVTTFSPTSNTLPPTDSTFDPTPTPTDMTASPTLETSSPTLITTISPTIAPNTTTTSSDPTARQSLSPTFPTLVVDKPTMPDTNNDGSGEVLVNTTMDSTVQHEVHSTIRYSHANTIYYILFISVATVFTVAGISGYIDSKYWRINDFYNISDVFHAMFHVFDSLSDVFLTIKISENIDQDGFLRLFVLSLIFVIVPAGVSFSQLLRQIRKHWWKDDKIKLWLTTHSRMLYLLSIICGSSFTAIKLVNTNLFQLQSMSMDLSKTQIAAFFTKRVWSIILFENIPQLALQAVYLWIINEFNDIAVSSMIFSMVSIFVTITSICTEKQILQSQGYGIVEFKVTGSSIIDKAHQYRNQKTKLQNQLASMLGLNGQLIEIQRPQSIPNGLKVTAIIHLNRITIRDIDYQKLLHNAEQNGQLAQIWKNAWDIKDNFVISIISFNVQESQQWIKNTVPIKVKSISYAQPLMNRNDNFVNVELEAMPQINNDLNTIGMTDDCDDSSNDSDNRDQYITTLGATNTTRNDTTNDGNTIQDNINKKQRHENDMYYVLMK